MASGIEHIIANPYWAGFIEGGLAFMMIMVCVWFVLWVLDEDNSGD